MESLPLKPIRTRSPITTPKGVNRIAIERWVRGWTQKKVNITDTDFAFVGPNKSQKQRAIVLKFACALQRELLHFEDWDGTPRQ